MRKTFPSYRQHDSNDCGPACIVIISKFYGKDYSLSEVKKNSFLERDGTSLVYLSDAAEKLGFKTLGASIAFEDLWRENPTPFIAHWRSRHFVVVYKFDKNKVYVSDPAHGLIEYTHIEFQEGWTKKGGEKKEGVILVLEPKPEFFELEPERYKIEKNNFSFLFKLLLPYRGYFLQLILGLVIGSLIQLTFPFITQSLVDVGIKNQDLNFIQLIILAHLALLFSAAVVDFIRSWILLYISTRINITIISDFLSKIMQLPLSFFDGKAIGDLLQRIGDHTRIESFLTSTTINTLFSIVNLVLFSIVLAIYDISIFFVFTIGSALYVIWILLFNKQRRKLDYKRFDQLAQNQDNVVNLLVGIHEIKLQNIEHEKRWSWEKIQAKLFRLNIQSLSLNQFQQGGGIFLTEAKNVLITYITVMAVIDGDITLGTMLAVQYIIGQLNAPINQLIGTIHAAQDAKISLDRLGEIHNMDNEDDDRKIHTFRSPETIYINNVSHHYGGRHSKKTLSDVSAVIPQGKVTAIVGASGSGKTTLLKLLLKFYVPVGGEIKIGNQVLDDINSKSWRNRCGVVMQDGYIFPDTIINNIVLKDGEVDFELLDYAIRMANLKGYIDGLPKGVDTFIGASGTGLSEGQKQRILIARVIYKRPDFVFLDEATNSLDAVNESLIHEHLIEFFRGKTVIIVAHRLSTVANADNIIVLNEGRIVEQGRHSDLIQKGGEYYQLVKKQIDLR